MRQLMLRTFIKNLREKLLINDDQFVVLSVRRLVERNGLDLLIECAKRLKTIDNISFVIVGDGPLMPDISAQVDKYRQTISNDELSETIYKLGFKLDQTLDKIISRLDYIIGGESDGN